MARKTAIVKQRSHGIYRGWDAKAKQLPRIAEFTLRVPAWIDIEFGFVINVKGGKNKELYYCIDHPGILDSHGNRRDPFDGTVYVKTNDWDFYLGDTIWNPIEDKIGIWRMWVELDGKTVAEKAFEVYRESRASCDK